jgi:hypothetical protein
VNLQCITVSPHSGLAIHRWVLNRLRAFHTRKHTEFLLDFESAGGRGISQALGLADSTNLDVVRNLTVKLHTLWLRRLLGVS